MTQVPIHLTRRFATWIAVLLLGLTGRLVLAGPVFPGAPAPAVAIEQRLGARLPLAASFTDAEGRSVRLGDYFAGDAGRGVPVVLVLGYYRCENLCETVMDGTLEALAISGLPTAAYRIVAVSIDPAETPADASARRRRDLAHADLAAARAGLGRGSAAGLSLDELVGDAASIAALAREAGFVFEQSSSGADGHAIAFAHAAGFLVVTPQGRVSRYFLGVRHDPLALRAAVDAASGDRIGGLVDRLLLLCAHLDPTLGRHSIAILNGLRLLCAGLVVLLGFWIWRHRRAPVRATRP